MANQVFTTTGSQTWNWPAGVTTVDAEAIGGGGGGGIAQGNPATGGGGKGGSYAKATITKAAESLLTIVVGTGGAIAAAGAASTVVQSGTTRVSAAGGGGGATQATSSANGAGATTLNGANTGTTTFAGGNGGTGNFTAGTQGSGAGGGAGGPTSVGGAASVNTAGTKGTGTFLDGVAYPGAGAAGVGNSLPGSAGPTYGGGASGGKANSGADQNGGVGGQGIVVLTWTAPNQAVTTQPIASTLGLTVPVIANTQLVTGVTLASTAALSVPTVAVAAGGGSGLAAAAAYGVANWKFEEASGTRADAINGYDAVEGFGTTNSTTGKFGNGINFVAANARFLGVADNTDVSGGATTITWRFWVKLTSKANHHEYLTKWGDHSIVVDGKNTEFAIAYNVSDDRFSATISPHAVDGANEVVTATNGGSPSTGVWYLVHVWYDHPTKVLGIAVNAGTANTLALNSSNFVSGIRNGDHPFLMGTLQTASDFAGNVLYADAVVDDVVILRGYALTAQDRTDDYNGGTGIAFADWAGSGGGGVSTAFIAAASVVNAPTVTGGATGLALAALYGVGNWRFEEAAGNTRVDSLNGYNLIEQNGTQANTTGKFGNATLSVASDQHWLRTTTAPTNLSAGTTKFEIRLWVKLTTKAYSVLVSKWGDTTGVNREYALQYYDVPDRFQFVVWDLDAGAVSLSADNFGAPTAGVWYLIHAWFDPSGSPDSIGISVNAGTPNTVTLAGNTGLLVGPNGLLVTALQNGGSPTSTTDVSGYANVAIDDLVILKGHLLTAQDRTDDYNGGSGLAFVDWAGGGGGAQAVAGATIASTAVVNAPTVAAGPVTITTGTCATTATLFAPTIATGPVTIVGGTVAATAQVNVPSVAVGPTTITTGTRPTTIQVFAPTVATGPVTVTAGTIGSTAVANAPTVAPGAVTVTTGTRPTTATVFAPSVAPGPVAPTGATIASTAVLYPLTVATGPVSVTGATIASSAQLFLPTVTQLALGSIGAETVASTLVLFPPSVAAGPVAVTTASRPTTAQLYAPTVAPGPVTVTLGTITNVAQLYAPSVTTGPVTIVAGTCAPTSQLFAPSVAAGAVAVTLPTIASTAQVFLPTVAGAGPAQGVTAGTRATTAALFPASIAVGPATVLAQTIVSTVLAFALTLTVGPVSEGGATIPSGNQRFPPTVALAGAQLVTTGTVASTGLRFPPRVAVPTAPVTLPHRASTLQLFAPTVTRGAASVGGGHRPSTVQVFVPRLAAQVLLGPALQSSTRAVFPPRLRVLLRTACSLGGFPVDTVPGGGTPIDPPDPPGQLCVFPPSTIMVGGYGDGFGYAGGPCYYLSPSGTSIYTPPAGSPVPGTGLSAFARMAQGHIALVGGNAPNFPISGAGVFAGCSLAFLSQFDDDADHRTGGFAVTADALGFWYTVVYQIGPAAGGSTISFTRLNAASVEVARWDIAAPIDSDNPYVIAMAVSGDGQTMFCWVQHLKFFPGDGLSHHFLHRFSLAGAGAYAGQVGTDYNFFSPGYNSLLVVPGSTDVLVAYNNLNGVYDQPSRPSALRRLTASGGVVWTAGTPAGAADLYWEGIAAGVPGDTHFLAWAYDGAVDTYSSCRYCWFSYATGAPDNSRNFTPEDADFQFDSQFVVLVDPPPARASRRRK